MTIPYTNVQCILLLLYGIVFGSEKINAFYINSNPRKLTTTKVTIHQYNLIQHSMIVLLASKEEDPDDDDDDDDDDI